MHIFFLDFDNVFLNYGPVQNKLSRKKATRSTERVAFMDSFGFFFSNCKY